MTLPLFTDTNVKPKSKRGFTLLELLISMAMLTVLMLATTDIFVRSFSNYQSTSELETNLADAQFLMNLLAKELRTSTVVSPTSSGSTQNIKFYEHSKGECVQYRFNSGSQSLEAARTSGGSSFDSCNNTSSLSGFTVVGIGSVTGSFNSVPSRTIASGSPRVGRVTMTLSIRSDDSNPLVLQTTASLRDYGYIGL